MSTAELRRAARIILIGAPGVGKGTQTNRMLKRFPQLSSISSGDLLRENVRNRTPLGIQAEALMKRGDLVPDSMILRLIRNALTTRGWLIPVGGVQPITLNSVAAWAELDPAARADDFLSGPELRILGGSGPMSSAGFGAEAAAAAASSSTPADAWITIPPARDAEYQYSEHPDASFVLDGFPRNAAQAAQLDALIPVNLAVHVHTPFELVAARMSNRWVHAASGRIYNTTFNPPRVPGQDDVTGEPLVQRDDDRPEVWRARLKTFEDASRDLLEFYARKGVLWKVEGESSDEITPRLFAEFERRFGV